MAYPTSAGNGYDRQNRQRRPIQQLDGAEQRLAHACVIAPEGERGEAKGGKRDAEQADRCEDVDDQNDLAVGAREAPGGACPRQGLRHRQLGQPLIVDHVE